MISDERSRKNGAITMSSNPVGRPQRSVWNDADLRSVYANVANVAGGREEIVLLFGLNQSWHAQQEEVEVHLTERIILNPHAAKRLSVLLSNAVDNYEKRFGALDIGLQPPKDATIQ